MGRKVRQRRQAHRSSARGVAIPDGRDGRYTDAAGNLRYYEPDFVAVLGDGKRYIVETKGQEDVNVANKDRAAAIWCENATILTGEPWKYLKVQQKEYAKLQADTFADLAVLGQGVLV